MTVVEYGVTKQGFVIKQLDGILNDKADRAREMFGMDVDLRSTSALRKILDVSAAEDAELWKRAEQQYYANFVTTASGDALDLLGVDVGVTRPLQYANGKVKFKLSGEAPGRRYNLPLGTLVETDPPVRQFRTDARVTLWDQAKEAEVAVTATSRGPTGNVAATDIKRINSVFAQRYLNLGGATIAAKNDQATAGGDVPEDDTIYRSLLVGHPRTLWTLQKVRDVVKHVEGVRDCRVFDPAGGVDVSLSKFNLFRFGERRFGVQRLLGTPYFFDILVAILPGLPWESEGAVVGIKDAVAAAINEVRPIGIFPNLRPANNVFVGIRARVLTKAGHDSNAVRSGIKAALELRVNAMGLGGSVLYSEVLCDCMRVAGVVDVQDLHLRPCPPVFASIDFGGRQRFGSLVIEAAVGENLPLLPDEIAVFKIDSLLIDVEVRDR